MSNETQKDFKQNLVNYFKGVKTEWSKVSWPTRNQVAVETVIVMIVVAFFTLVVFAMDKLFIWLLDLIK